MAHAVYNGPPFILVQAGAVSVTAFGAVGDGVVDDTAAIQDALDFGGLLVFPPGTYRITAQVSGASNTTVFGYEAKLVLDGATLYDGLVWENKTNVRVFGLEIDGRKSIKNAGVDVGAGLYLHQVSDAVISDCLIHDTHEHGIQLGGSFDLDTADSSRIAIRDCTIRDAGNVAGNRGTGIFAFWRMKDLRIHGCAISGCHAGGIMVDDSSSDATPGKEAERVVISGNDIVNCPGPLSRAIVVEGSRHITVTGNVISGVHSGIVFSNGQANSDTGLSTINGNEINCEGNGIWVFDARGVAISGNTVELDGASSSFVAAIKLEHNTGTAPFDITISGNQVRSDGPGISNRKSGGYVETAGANIVVDGNTVVWTGGVPDANHVGIQLNFVDGAVVRNNKVIGFFDGVFTDSACLSPVMQDNQPVNSTHCGVRVGAAASLVKGNHTRGSVTSGYIFDASARVASTRFEGNTADDTMFSGTTAGPTYVWPAMTSAAAANIKSANYTVLVTDGVLIASGHSGAITFTLPATPAPGQRLEVANNSASFTVLLARNGQTINGAAADLTVAVSSQVTICFIPGTGWFRIA